MVLRTIVLAISVVQCISKKASMPCVELKNAAVSNLCMPVVGLGTWGYKGPNAPEAEDWGGNTSIAPTVSWLKQGGRRIDTAYSYHSIPAMGPAIKLSGIPRSEIFITSKIGSYGMGFNETLNQTQQLLNYLQTSYIDLLLIHWPDQNNVVKSTDPACQGSTPAKCRQSTWRAMESLFQKKVLRAIGVSNFEKNHLQDIFDLKSSVPAVNQFEFHGYWHEFELVQYCQSLNITVNGYSPLGASDWAPRHKDWIFPLPEHPVAASIAEKYNKTAAQVWLRWMWQGHSVICNPRTLKTNHQLENMNIFDFELNSQEIDALNSVDPPENNKVCPDPHGYP